VLERVLSLLENYEPTISSIVGLLTLCAAVWGLLRLRITSRKAQTETPSQLPAHPHASERSRWQSLFDLGLSEHSQLEELVSVRTVNVVLFCLSLLSLPWLLVCLLFFESAFLTIMNVVVFSGALLGFALQHAGATTAARWLVILLVSFYWLGTILAVGAEQGLEYLLAGLVAMPVLMLSRAQTGQRILSILFIAGMFLLGVSLTNGKPPALPMSETALTIGYHANAIFLAAIIFASVSYYKRFAASSYQMLSSKQRENDALVSKLIPPDIALQMVNKEAAAAQWHPEGTVLVGTLTGFSDLYSRLPAIDLVKKLDELYSRFDEIIEHRGLEKVKTLGTTYVAAAGLDVSSDGYAQVACSALAIRAIVEDFAREQDLAVGFRCGLATGLTISGVIGKSRPRFDIWGEALDAATQLEREADDGEILVNDTAYWRLNRDFTLVKDETSATAFKLISELHSNELAS
jgi:adenylate cyclase